MSWRALVLSVMRVPHQPEPPPGSPPRTFRAAPNYLTLRIVQWVFVQPLLLTLPSVVTATLYAVSQRQEPGAVRSVLQVVLIVAWTLYVIQVAFSWAVLRLDYELRWYMLSNRAIRIREGIMVVREKTMALANVQNISIQQGPLERLLGIANVEVKTAGGGASAGGPHGKGEGVGEPMHIAFFRGVANAEEIRDLVRDAVRRQKDSGLGDPGEQHDAVPHPSAAVAATTLLVEVRKLRAVVER